MDIPWLAIAVMVLSLAYLAGSIVGLIWFGVVQTKIHNKMNTSEGEETDGN